jgi:hypothetical protein
VREQLMAQIRDHQGELSTCASNVVRADVGSDGRHRRNWFGQDHATGSVPVRGRFLQQRHHRVHATASCRRNVGREACVGGDGVRAGVYGRLCYPIRGLHLKGHQDQV